MTRGFLRAGHWPTLLAAFLYFDVSFMIWVILGPLGVFVGEQLHLSPSQKGLLIATPLLAGSFFRPLLGWLADAIGGRRAGLVGLGVSAAPLLMGWRGEASLPWLYAVAVLLGVAGASFAVALPLASRWYPAEYQGLAMGIAGAGNSGTLLATLFAPRLAQAYGWQNAFGIALLPLLAVLTLFWLTARDAPGERKASSWSSYRSVLTQPDTGLFCFFYSITFGGFVGLASFLTLFFYDQYGMSKVAAGDYATVMVLCGSFLRPVGGWAADRVGGYRMLMGVLVVSAAAVLALAMLPSPPVALALLGLTMAMFGMGNGAIFQLAPQRFAGSIGIVTGLVGAAGGVGGFFLPSVFGGLKDRLGSYSAGFATFGVVIILGAFVLIAVARRWQREWPRDVVQRAGLIWSWRSRKVEA
jgi:NNP family nitrate/nitrite transporter-like MFS transporter